MKTLRQYIKPPSDSFLNGFVTGSVAIFLWVKLLDAILR
jgi:hypothetical protein